LPLDREHVGAVHAHDHVVNATQAGFPALREKASTHALARVVVRLADAIVDPAHALADLLQHGVVRVVGIGRAITQRQ